MSRLAGSDQIGDWDAARRGQEYRMRHGARGRDALRLRCCMTVCCRLKGEGDCASHLCCLLMTKNGRRIFDSESMNYSKWCFDCLVCVSMLHSLFARFQDCASVVVRSLLRTTQSELIF